LIQHKPKEIESSASPEKFITILKKLIWKLGKDSYLQWINYNIMPFSRLVNPQVIYINTLMKELNSLNDDLYESLMDSESDNARATAKALVNRLEDVIQTLERG